MRAESSTPAPLLTFCLSTFPAACLGCSRTLLTAVFVFAGFLLMTGGNARAQGTVATDRAALVAFYSATDGGNWANRTNWLTNAALSEWYGVATNINGRVSSLYLPRNQLTGEIPAELGDLTNLQFLYLYDNALSGEIPVELGNLTKLQELYLSKNNLSGEIPVELGNLTKLQELSLWGNWLSGTIPAELGGLGNLRRLYVGTNGLSGEIPVELGNLTKLQRLSLSLNDLSGEIPVELGNLTNLQELYLSLNTLSGEIPVELGNMTNLEVLYLDFNELSGEIPAALGDLANLQRVYLNHNELSGTIPAELGALTDLQVLGLYENPLSGTIPVELGNLTNLRKLDLYENGLSGAIPAELGNLTDLRELDLSENGLSGAIPAELGNLTKLRELDLYENGLSGAIPAELGNLTNLQVLDLSENGLSGAIPAELGNLTDLQKLYLYDNELSGPLPLPLSALSQLSVLDIRLTTLCAPTDTAFQAWLATINFKGAICDTPQNPLPTTPTPPPSPEPEPEPDPGGTGGGGFGGGGGSTTSAPGAVRNLTAVGGDGEVVLSWDAPASDGGAEITDYEYRIDGSGTWTSIGSTNTTHTVTGLVNGAEYTFEVRAVNRIGKGRTSNRAGVAPEAPELFTLDFTHFANGDGTTSDLVFVNVPPQPVRPAIYFYDTEGNPIAAESVVDITGDLEIREDGGLAVRREMEPLGELTISTHGRGEQVTGSVRVVSGAPIGGMLRYNLPHVGVAVVGAGPPLGDALFPVRRREGGINTGVAIHNLEEEPMEVSCRLMSGGTVLEEVGIPLEANGQTSWSIDQAFTAADTSDFVGSVRCYTVGEGLFSAVALEMDSGTRIFTILPVVPVDRGRRGRAAALDLAHFANGDGITSDLVFVNVKTQPSGRGLTPFDSSIPSIRPAIYFYDTEGNPIAAESVVDVTGDLETREDGALTVRTEMDPLGVLTMSTHGRGDLVTGSVRVVSARPIGGMLRFDLPHVGEAVAEASQPVSDALFPVRRREGGINTGVAIHNLESSSELVRCELLREGVLLDSVSLPLEANGQTSWTIDAAFPATDTSDFVGSVRCDAVGEGRFSAVALEMDPGARTFITLPLFPVEERTDQE